MQKITFINKFGDSIVFSNTPPFLLEKIDANSIGSISDIQKAIGQDGQTTQGTTLNARTIMLDLAFVGTLNGKYSDIEMRRNWKTICKTFLVGQVGTLIYENDGGVYKIECYPFELPNFDRMAGTFSKFKLQLIADEPFWLSKEMFCAKLGQITGGIKFPLTYPLVYGKWTTSATINNNTNLKLPCIVELSTDAEYVKVINNTTGEFIKVEKAIESNQKLIIDTGKCTVEIVTYDELGNETAREYANYKITYDSTYFLLQEGVNEISIENSSAGAIIPATICYYKRYLGV